MTRIAWIALIVLDGVLGLFVLADLSESARGDNYFSGFIIGDLGVMAGGSACIVALDIAIRHLLSRRPASSQH